MAALFSAKCWAKRLYRESFHFHALLKHVEKTGQYTTEQIEHYQNSRLRRIIQHCYRNVPYYTDLFNRLRLKPSQIQSHQELKKIPFLTKQLVNDNFDKLIARSNHPLLYRTAHTSGVSGSPAKFLRDYQSINFEHAAVRHYWQQSGDNGKKRITFRGDVVVPMSQSEPPFWKYNPANQELLMCGFHLNWKNSPAYLEKILAFQPAILSCYPSTGYLLAKIFQSHGIAYPLDAVFTSSETLEPEIKAFIEETFQTRIYDWYGQGERVSAIGLCRQGRYHIQEDYSITEIVQTPHGYELVGTHLHNTIMPLLRYRTQDFVEPENSTCGCGSAFRTVRKILGRSGPCLLTPEGYRISSANHIFHGIHNLVEAQLVQESLHEITIRVITNGQFTEADYRALIQSALKHTSPQMKIRVEEVDQIERGPNGKFISILSTLEEAHRPYDPPQPRAYIEPTKAMTS